MPQSISAASVAIFKGPNVLLIQRALPPLAGYWTLPGGKVEPKESAMDCAMREIDEELSLSLAPPVAVTQLRSGKHLLQVFVAHMPEAAPAPGVEILDWQFVRPDALEGLKTTPDLAEVLVLAQQKLALV